MHVNIYKVMLFFQTYLNGSVLTLIRALVTGGETAEFEKMIAEGLGIVRKNTLDDTSSARKRSHMAQLSLSSGPLEKLKVCLDENHFTSNY